jgi:acyl-CoA synthetase (AMP-forming)/AMP-acid ligase II
MQITQSIRRAVQIHGGRAATIQGSRRHTWSEFGHRVASLAGILHQKGLTRDGRVGLLAMNGDRYLESFYGAIWAGGILVPINFRFSVAEIVFCLNDCGAEILIVDDAFSPIVPDLRAQAPGLRDVISMGEADTAAYEQLLSSTAPALDAMHSGDDVAGIFYTGGTFES